MKIKRFAAAVMILLASLWLWSNWQSSARAQIPPHINFTGKVTNLDGTEVADGTYDFSFSLYTQPTGGAAIWSEDLTAATRFSGNISGASAVAEGIQYTYSGASATGTLRLGQYLTNASTSESVLIVDYDTGANTITVASGSPAWSTPDPINNRPIVEGGVININLGTVSGLSAIDMNQELYLEVVFNSETMQPRKFLTPEAQALEAYRLGGRTGGEFAALAESEIITGDWDFNNIVDISTTSSQTALTVAQNGSGRIVEFKQAATTTLAILPSGRVQIGNYTLPFDDGSPGYVLKTDGAGNVSWQNDLVGGFGAGGGDMLWASNTADTLIRPIDSNYVVLIGNITTSTLDDMIFEVDGPSLFDTVNISDQQELRLYDADSSNYVGLRASSTVNTDLLFTLPDGYGLAGQVLTTDGNGGLTWTSSAGLNASGVQIGWLATWLNGTTLTASNTLQIAYGGTGAQTATGARANLGLSDIYEYGINTTATSGWIWLADGNGRGRWVATATLDITDEETVRFIGTTTALQDGSFSTSTLTGYQAGNNICAAEYPNSVMCRTYDILVSIEQSSIIDWNGDDAWVAEGPPGYTSNSNDCNGWTSHSNTALGAFWVFDRDGGGAGWLVNCANTKPIACCRKQ